MNADMAHAEDERAEREAEIAADERYANAVNGAAAGLRVVWAGLRAKERHVARAYSSLLVAVAAELRHGQEGNDLLALLEDYGPGAVAVAVKRAVDEPQPGEP